MDKPKWQDELAAQKRKDLFTKIALWGGLALFLVGSIWALTVASSSSSSSSSTSSLTAPKVSSKDFQSGPGNAKVTVIEYADFQCPACEAYYPVVKQLMADYKGKVNFVYRFFPLKTVHHNALISSQAAYAASLQGNAQENFWKMHDKLFDTQSTWSGMTDPTNTYIDYAKSLGLNTDQFAKDLTAKVTTDFVDNAYNDALNLGLNGTPTFFINGKQVQNPNGYQPFKQEIDNALAGK